MGKWHTALPYAPMNGLPSTVTPPGKPQTANNAEKWAGRGAGRGPGGPPHQSHAGSRSRIRWGLLALLLGLPAHAATRPQYGGTLRVEMRLNVQTPDPPPLLGPAFQITRWEAGRLAIYEADENAPGGRPFLNSVEVQLNRSLRDQASDLELGKADVVELGPNEVRRQPAGRRIWSSNPVRVLALVFSPRVDDVRVREALALAVDRAAIQRVLLQRQGEVSAALLPQWLSGYAFLFRAVTDLGRARQLSPGARPITLAAADPASRPIAERIAVDARSAGLAIFVTSQADTADVTLVELRIGTSDPARALAQLAATLGAAMPARIDTPEQAYAAERSLLEGFRVIPLVHLPDVYGVSPRVQGGPGIAPTGEWHFETLWLESARP